MVASNIIVQPRLKPLVYTKNDLNRQSFPAPVRATTTTSPEPQAKKRSESPDGREGGRESITTASIPFYRWEDQPYNRRGYKYKPCSHNLLFPANIYSTTDLMPYQVRASYFDRSSGIMLSSDGSMVTTERGWRSARANVGIREGSYYMEFNIVRANEGKSHIRFGLSRKEASLEAPVGYDAYGYGLRDIEGMKVHLSRPREFCNELFRSGDVIGVLVTLPSLKDHKESLSQFIENLNLNNGVGDSQAPNPNKKALNKRLKKAIQIDSTRFNVHNNIVRDQIPIKYKSKLYYEQYEYTQIPEMEHLVTPMKLVGEKAIIFQQREDDDEASLENKLPKIPHSSIRVFKNGKDMGIAFQNLISFLATDDNKFQNTKQNSNPSYHNTDDGTLGYYPTMSVFQNGIVGLNAGPDFKYPPLEFEYEYKPLCERYDDHVIEEWYWDIIDEIEAEQLDELEDLQKTKLLKGSNSTASVAVPIEPPIVNTSQIATPQPIKENSPCP